MHSINDFVSRMLYGGKTPRSNGPQARPPAQGDGYEQRPDFDLKKHYADKNAAAARSRALSSKNRKAADPRDTPKYGVEASRPYSTQSKHGTARGGTVGSW